MKRRLFLLVFLVALLATACASEGLPNSYADQDERAGTQFAAACVEALAGTDTSDAASLCQCAFYTVASQMTFDEFIELDAKLKDDPEALTLEEREMLENVSLPCDVTDADIDRTPSSE